MNRHPLRPQKALDRRGYFLRGRGAHKVLAKTRPRAFMAKEPRPPAMLGLFLYAADIEGA